MPRNAALAELSVNAERLWESHMLMAEIGALPHGGSCRLALSQDDKRGRDLFVEWCRSAGCDVEFDAIGNIYARRPGRDASLPPAATGSHLDTQPHGGKFDGIFGVLAGLEVIRTLNDHAIATRAPVEVIVWTNEEGARFVPPLTGSQVFVGGLPLAEIHRARTRDGTRVKDDLREIGYLGDPLCSDAHRLRCFIEAHIEQGPILENSDKQIGVVSKIQGMRAFSVEVSGEDNHAGTTPLNLRKDALLGAARMTVRLNEIGRAEDDSTRITVGRFEVRPNSTSTIPGKVLFHIDLRHPDEEVLARLEARVHEDIGLISSESGLTAEIKRILAIDPTLFASEVVERVRETAAALGFTHREMVSGAGHDAMNIAKVAPTAMIFVPCEGGISHNEAEFASQEDLAAGADVLLHSLLKFAEVA